MTDHTCKWVICAGWDGEPFVYCAHPRGHEKACMMSIEEAEARLNNHAAPKRRLRLVETVGDMIVDADEYELERVVVSKDLLEGILAVLNEYETLKNATEKTKAWLYLEGMFRMNPAITLDDVDDAKRTMRDAYADMLEGKR